MSYAQRVKQAIYSDATQADPLSLDALGQALDALNLESLSLQSPSNTEQLKQPVTVSKAQLRPLLSEMFYGKAVLEDFSAAVPAILLGIQHYIDKEKLRVRGRLGDLRIDYRTTETGIPFLAARLETALQCGGFVSNTKYDDTDPYETCEWLLRPLVY